MVKRNPVGREKDSGTVTAKPTVDVNPLPRMFLKQGKKLRDLFVSWRRPAVSRDRNQANCKFLCFAAFLLPRSFKFAAQIHDQCDAKFVQFFDAVFIRL